MFLSYSGFNHFAMDRIDRIDRFSELEHHEDHDHELENNDHNEDENNNPNKVLEKSVEETWEWEWEEEEGEQEGEQENRDFRVFAEWVHYLMGIGALAEDVVLEYADQLTSFGVETREDFMSSLLKNEDFANMGITGEDRAVIAWSIVSGK